MNSTSRQLSPLVRGRRSRSLGRPKIKNSSLNIREIIHGLGVELNSGDAISRQERIYPVQTLSHASRHLRIEPRRLRTSSQSYRDSNIRTALSAAARNPSSYRLIDSIKLHLSSDNFFLATRNVNMVTRNITFRPLNHAAAPTRPRTLVRVETAPALSPIPISMNRSRSSEKSHAKLPYLCPICLDLVGMSSNGAIVSTYCGHLFCGK